MSVDVTRTWWIVGEPERRVVLRLSGPHPSTDAASVGVGVTITGLEPRWAEERRIFGVDELQALQLALVVAAAAIETDRDGARLAGTPDALLPTGHDLAGAAQGL